MGFDLSEDRTRNAEGRRFDTGQLHAPGLLAQRQSYSLLMRRSRVRVPHGPRNTRRYNSAEECHATNVDVVGSIPTSASHWIVCSWDDL